MRRYLLDLSRRHDRQVLERLYYMQNRDNVLRTTRRPLRPDTSFRANGSNFRNETIDGRQPCMRSIPWLAQGAGLRLT